jgi:excisionase family DNA binding protein
MSGPALALVQSGQSAPPYGPERLREDLAGTPAPAAPPGGPDVALSLAELAALAPMVRRHVRGLHRNGAYPDPVLRRVAAVVDYADALVRLAEVSDSATRQPHFAGREAEARLSTSDPLSVAEVAEVAGASERTVRHAAAIGRLLGRRTGRAWTFERHHVAAWMAARAQRSA